LLWQQPLLWQLQHLSQYVFACCHCHISFTSLVDDFKIACWTKDPLQSKGAVLDWSRALVLVGNVAVSLQQQQQQQQQTLQRYQPL
jgi:hypothetical protein